MSRRQQMLDAAMELADCGYPVFPLRGKVPALSPALAFVLTMDAAGAVDITSNVDPTTLVALLRLIAMNVAAVGQVDGGQALFSLLDGLLMGRLPKVTTELDLTGQPFAWTVTP